MSKWKYQLGYHRSELGQKIAPTGLEEAGLSKASTGRSSGRVFGGDFSQSRYDCRPVATSAACRRDRDPRGEWLDGAADRWKQKDRKEGLGWRVAGMKPIDGE
ncbi:hypothetical protein HPP92_003440 [Vanilla planifolia]|uniref:Uncharacterized protein n=1 Tax=Vanilla planifolia TaxID=51239 RepID=A0A835RZY8_VANPL|nr:hypothetical protein HPP92_003440 [Vanilla planifolia]